MAWRPTASLEILRLRTKLYQDIRNFFADRQVLEVETPILSIGSVPEPTIEPLYTDYSDETRLFLQTSPELAMKRLLAAGSGAIFQISKTFRNDEAGRWHNPEFTMLEWYQPEFNQADLIKEVDEFFQSILHCEPAECLDYCDIFQRYTDLHPLDTSLSELQKLVKNIQNSESLDRDSCLQLIISQQIESKLGQDKPTIIRDFPATQAALARKKVSNPSLAERFEVYVQGIELANGFYELTDPIEQRERFQQDLAIRQEFDLPIHPLDEDFLAALEYGLPDCSGVAVGLDRLLMLLTGAKHINEVLAFPTLPNKNYPH